MKLIAVGLVVELHAAFAITRLMASIFVGVSTIDFRHLRRYLAALKSNRPRRLLCPGAACGKSRFDCGAQVRVVHAMG